MKDKIKKYFKDNNLPNPGVINHVGRWAYGECYAVTCGWFRLKKYCVYFDENNEIKSVRLRG